MLPSLQQTKSTTNIGWTFLRLVAAESFLVRKGRIDEFVNHYRYNPELGLHMIAQNLYQDVRAVGMTLLRLRFEQAQAIIREITGRDQSP